MDITFQCLTHKTVISFYFLFIYLFIYFLVFRSLDYGRTCWRLFQKRFTCNKLDIYTFLSTEENGYDEYKYNEFTDIVKCIKILSDINKISNELFTFSLFWFIECFTLLSAIFQPSRGNHGYNEDVSYISWRNITVLGGWYPRRLILHQQTYRPSVSNTNVEI